MVSKQLLKLLKAAICLAAVLITAASLAIAINDSWLVRINYYRTMAGLSPFKFDNRMTARATDFARLLVYKEFAEIRAGRSVPVENHFANADISWFAGREDFVAGGMSDTVAARKALVPTSVIDGWIADPINRLPLMARQLSDGSVAYGDFCAEGICTAALCSSDRSLSLKGYYFRGFPEKYQTPVLFPPDHSTIDMISLGHQSPELFGNCAFRTPTGLPITIQLGRWMSPKITAGSITVGGKPVQACAIDATNYFNSDQAAAIRLRYKLLQFGAVVIVPRLPLLPNVRYSVHAVVADHDVYNWSFSTSAKAVAVP